MKIIPTPIQDCCLYELDRFYDNRGFFQELYKDKIIDIQQINWSSSVMDTIRGIHIAPWDKLVTCIIGEIYDVVIDFRESSPTYLKQFAITLKPEIANSILIPDGCGHSFMSIRDSTVIYIQNKIYNPSEERSINYQYVKWPKPKNKYILSEKDINAQLLETPFQ